MYQHFIALYRLHEAREQRAGSMMSMHLEQLRSGLMYNLANGPQVISGYRGLR